MEPSKDTGIAAEYIKQIHQNRLTDYPEAIRSSRLLLQYGREHKDTALMGYASYHMAEGYYFNNNNTKALTTLNDAIRYLLEGTDYSYLARCYNLYGVIYAVQGNLPASLENYFTAISYCREYRYFYMEAILTSNIAATYFDLLDFKNAARYFIHALSLYRKGKKEPTYYNNILLVTSSLGICYCNLSQMAQAAKVKEKLLGLMPQASHSCFLTNAYLFLAKYYQLNQAYLSRDFYIQKGILAARTADNFLNSVDDYQELCRFLLEIGQYDAFTELFQIVTEKTEYLKITYVSFRNMQLKISFLKKTGRTDLLPDALQRYYELSLEQDREDQKTAYNSMKIRIAYENALKTQQRLERKKEQLRRKSETDSMTGLPNRFRLNDYLEEVFAATLRNRIPLAIELLDVDYFKEYNDTYGHMAGDQCLTELAEELLSMNGPGVFCARYGGDEFIIVYSGKSKEEVRDLAEQLRLRIADRQIRHSASAAAPYLTISQGICYGIPDSGSRAWDFLYQADTALYKLKQQTRNAVNMVDKKTL